MSKNGEYIGRRYVKLLMVPREEMEDQVRLGTLAIPGAAARAMQVAQIRDPRVHLGPRVTFQGYPPVQYWPAGRIGEGLVAASTPIMPGLLMPSTAPPIMGSAVHG